MRASKRLQGCGTDEVGGSFKTVPAMQGSTPARVVMPLKASPLPEHEEAEDSSDLYLESASVTAVRKPRRARMKAMAIAEARLNKLSEELLALADELRYLHPAMADALDDAWHSTDEALEILVDPQAW